MTELDELATALAAFQAEVPVIPKKQTAKVETQRGPSYSYTYADLAAIAPVVMPLLAKHGLAFTALPTGGKKDRGPVLVGMLLHTSGQRVTGELPITGRTPQEIGSSLTYGRRYLLGCLTGVVTDDDDDGQIAERSTRTRKAAKVTEAGPPVAPPIPIQRQSRPRGSGPAPGPQPSDPEPAVSPPGPVPEGTPPGNPGTGQPDRTPDPELVTDAQRRALFGAVGKALGPDAGRDERLALCAAIVGRPLATSTELGRSETSAILTWLEDKRLGRVGWAWDPATGTGSVFLRDRPPEPPEQDDPFPDGGSDD